MTTTIIARVVAYYPEVISSNIQKLKDTVFIGDYVGLHRRHDFPGKMYGILRRQLPERYGFTKKRREESTRRGVCGV